MIVSTDFGQETSHVHTHDHSWVYQTVKEFVRLAFTRVCVSRYKRGVDKGWLQGCAKPSFFQNYD
jgi:hypothetical protein